MREEIESIVEELKRLRHQGETHVPVSAEAMAMLKDRVLGFESNAPESAVSVAVEETPEEAAPLQIPDNIRSATAADFDEILKAKPKPKAPASTGEASMNRKVNFPFPPSIALSSGSKDEQWETLKQLVLADATCLSNSLKGKLVFGHGNLNATIMFCGDAPRVEDEESGEPFTGPDGELMKKMVGAMGLKWDEVYVSNLMIWKPQAGDAAGSRTAKKHELAYCLPYLKAQINIVKPKIIVALGATTVKGIFGSDTIRNLRDEKGNWRSFEDIPTMITYHPSYLLRYADRRSKRSAWEDLLRVMERAQLAISEKQKGYFL